MQIDDDMQAVTQAAEAKPMIVRLRTKTMALNRRDLNTGADMGWYYSGRDYTVYSAVDGWVALNANKNHWIPPGAWFEVGVVDPPPVDPPPVDPPPVTDIKVILFEYNPVTNQYRINGGTWENA
jgi:hypothetical protein